MTDKQDITPTQSEHALAQEILSYIRFYGVTMSREHVIARMIASHTAQAREEGSRMALDAAFNAVRDSRAHDCTHDLSTYHGALSTLRYLDPAEIVKGKA